MEILSDAEKMLESLPKADIERYTELIKDDYFGYIFYKREKNGDKFCNCSACGKTFNANYKKRRSYTADDVEFYNAKHNDIVVCPKCGRKATMKCQGRIKNYSRLNEIRFYAFFEAVSSDEVLIRCYKVGKLYYNYNVCNDLQYVLDSVYILQPGEAYRIVNRWYGGAYETKLYDPFLFGYAQGQKYMDYDIIYLSEPGDTFLKYCQLDKYIYYIRAHGIRFSHNSLNEGIKFIRYLCMCSLYPSIEMFIKLGFTDAVIDLVQFYEPNKQLFDWDADNPVDAFRCNDKQEFNELRELALKGRYNFVGLLKTLKQIRKIEPSLPTSMAEVYSRVDKDSIETLKRMISMSGKTFAQCTNYLLKQLNQRSLHYFDIGIWKDYIEAAEKLGYDLSVETVVLPRNLREAHDAATAAVEYKENKEKLELMKNLDVNRRKKYEYSDGEFMIRLPNSMQEIIDEGKVLHHCVGGYADRHADGKTTILFLRKCSAPDEPYYTVEIIGNKIVQYHGYANERNTHGKKDPNVVKFVEKWHKWVQQGSKPQKAKGKSKNKATQKLSA